MQNYKGFEIDFRDASEPDCLRTDTFVRLGNVFVLAVPSALWTSGPRWEAEMDAFIQEVEETVWEASRNALIKMGESLSCGFYSCGPNVRVMEVFSEIYNSLVRSEGEPLPPMPWPKSLTFRDKVEMIWRAMDAAHVPDPYLSRMNDIWDEIFPDGLVM